MIHRCFHSQTCRPLRRRNRKRSHVGCPKAKPLAMAGRRVSGNPHAASLYPAGLIDCRELRECGKWFFLAIAHRITQTFRLDRASRWAGSWSGSRVPHGARWRSRPRRRGRPHRTRARPDGSDRPRIRNTGKAAGTDSTRRDARPRRIWHLTGRERSSSARKMQFYWESACGRPATRTNDVV